MPSTETEEGNTPHSSDDARPPVKTAMSQLANPAPLGLFGFAVITTFSGFLKVDGNSALATDGLRAYIGFWIGGLSQVISGLLQFPRNNTHSATVFNVFGLYHFALGCIFYSRSDGVLPGVFYGRSAATLYFILMLTTFILWIPTFRMNKVLNVTLLTVVGVFAADGVAEATERRGFEIAAGVLSLIAAALAFYLALVDLVNEAWGKDILPIFPHEDHAADYASGHGKRYTPKLHFHKSTVSAPHSA